MSATPAAQAEIEVTEAAAEEALDLLAGEDLDTDEAGLRLFVQQGGCAGLSYG
ncbi:MAG: iron-sulfur cluster assembly accessory protein, partial [Halobacteriales archaeon]